jgi:adenylate kinase family enzyme
MAFVLYLIGKPGVGKYTIAKSLCSKHNFIIYDNQMINNYTPENASNKIFNYMIKAWND